MYLYCDRSPLEARNLSFETFAAHSQSIKQGEGVAMLRTLLFIIVIILLLGALPTWPYSTGWGYYPSSGLGLVLLILVILLLVGRI